MTLQEQEIYAVSYANSKAWQIFNKIPSQLRPTLDIDDIAQNMLLEYVKYKNKYDPEKPFKPWIHTVMGNRGVDDVTRSWDYFTLGKDAFDGEPDLVKEYKDGGDEGEYELVVADIRTPEMLCISYYEEKSMEEKIVVLTSEVKALCRRFDFKFDDENYVKSLAQVLDKTLNKMTDEEFKELPYQMQLKLAEYGEALDASNLAVTVSGKIRSEGIVSVIRQCVQGGIIDFKQVKKRLDETGMPYSEDSVRTLLWEEKKRAGVPITKGRTGVMARMRELFDYGRGVTTVAEMLVLLKEEGIKHQPSTVRTYTQDLRRTHGITTK